MLKDEKYFEIKRRAARLGALRRYELYGNPGTTEGRKLGGQKSISTHRKIALGGFQLLRNVVKPRKSFALAELLGIFIGDGHLAEYQATVVTSLKTDFKHAQYISNLIQRIFRISAPLKKKPNYGAVVVVVSSKMVVKLLAGFGMPKGNKLAGELKIPRWIYLSRSYMRWFIRGLFDTDGCVFLDKHIINGRHYAHLGWVITSASVTLLEDIRSMLVALGYHPTWRVSQNSVYLRKQVEVKRYFKEIGSSNSKHLGRFTKFCGRVPKRS